MVTTEVKPYAMTKPANKVCVRGEPIVTEFQVETTTSCKPGALVIKGSSSSEVVCSTAATDNCIGVLGYEQANPNWKPATIDTAYATDSFAPVMFGPGYVAQLILADSQTVVIGDYLVAAASGQCAKAANITVTTGAATASAVVSTTPTTSGGRPLNPIIGQALEDVTTSGAADRILVKMFI